MKTREELEKMFDEKFELYEKIYYDNHEPEYIIRDNEVKQFIFETIIPEVIREILPEKELEMDPLKLIWNIIEASGNTWYNVAISQVKQKAKELYWIDL